MAVTKKSPVNNHSGSLKPVGTKRPPVKKANQTVLRIKKDNSSEGRKRQKEDRLDYMHNKSAIKRENKKRLMHMTMKKRKLRAERAVFIRAKNAGKSTSQANLAVQKYKMRKASGK